MKETKKKLFKSGRFYVSFLRAAFRIDGMCLCVLFRKDDDDEKKLFLDPASAATAAA